MTVCTSMPSCVSRRANSAALYAATPPVTPNNSRFLGKEDIHVDMLIELGFPRVNLYHLYSLAYSQKAMNKIPIDLNH